MLNFDFFFLLILSFFMLFLDPAVRWAGLFSPFRLTKFKFIIFFLFSHYSFFILILLRFFLFCLKLFLFFEDFL